MPSNAVPVQGDGQAERVEQALGDFGIRTGSPKQRKPMARRLVREGMTDTDLRFIGDCIERRYSDPIEASSVLAGQLRDARWKTTLAEFYRLHAKAEERKAAREAGDSDDDDGQRNVMEDREERQLEWEMQVEIEAQEKEGVTLSEEGARKMVLAKRQDRLIAYGIWGDGWSLQEAAKRTGRSPAALKRLLEDYAEELGYDAERVIARASGKAKPKTRTGKKLAQGGQS